MKSYNIFLKEKNEKKIVDNILFLQDNFDFKPCLLNFYWLITNKLYLHLFFIIFILLFIIMYNIYLCALSFLSICLLLGFYGNKILIKNLVRVQDCKFLGKCIGNNITEAKKSFLDDWNKDLEKDFKQEEKNEEIKKEEDKFIFKDDF